MRRFVGMLLLGLFFLSTVTTAQNSSSNGDEEGLNDTIGEFLDDGRALWKHGSSGFAFYHDGERVKGLRTVRDGDDLIVFYSKIDRIYRLVDFEKLDDSTLRSAGIDHKFTENEALWKRNQSGFFFYYQGKRIKGLRTIFDGDDVVLFHPKAGKFYRLGNFENRQDSIVRPAEQDTKFSDHPALWKRNQSGFFF